MHCWFWSKKIVENSCFESKDTIHVLYSQFTHAKKSEKKKMICEFVHTFRLFNKLAEINTYTKL